MQPNLHLLWQISNGIHRLAWPVAGSKFVAALAHSHQNSYAKNHEKPQRQNPGSTVCNDDELDTGEELINAFLGWQRKQPNKQTPRYQTNNPARFHALIRHQFQFLFWWLLDRHLCHRHVFLPACFYWNGRFETLVEKLFGSFLKMVGIHRW